MWVSQSILIGLKVVLNENEWKMELCSLGESPFFERSNNWRAWQKQRDDKGELVGLSILLIWFGDRLVTDWETQAERKRKQICDVKAARWDMEIGKIRPAGGVQVSPSAWSFHAKSGIFRLSNLSIHFLYFCQTVIMSAKQCQLKHNRLSALFTCCETLWMNILVILTEQHRKRSVAVSYMYQCGLWVRVFAWWRDHVLRAVEGTLGWAIKRVDGCPCDKAFGMPSRFLFVARDEGDFCKMSYMVS